MFRYIPSDKSLECALSFTSRKASLPGDTPGVTRYPHPESNNTLKSKAPASGVPARLRVFCLTTMLYPSLPNSASSSAPASPQGLSGVVRPVGLCTEGIWKRWQSSPDPKSGGYARASTLGQGPAPFPPDAGAQSTASHDERSIEARDQAFCRSAIFPCQKIDDRAKRKNWGPSRAENLWRVSAATISTRASHSHLQPSRTLEAGAVVAQSSSHGARRPGKGTAKWRRAQRSAIAGRSAPSRHMTVRPRSSG